jgi:hypothetical membrane protein
MWQHAANIIVGLGLVAIAVFGELIGFVENIFAWIFISAGVAVIVFGAWGLYDELSHEENHEDDR